MSESMRSRALRPLSYPELLVVSCVADLTKTPHVDIAGVRQGVYLYAPDQADKNSLYFLVATQDLASPIGPEHKLSIHEPLVDNANIVIPGDILESVVVATSEEGLLVSSSSSKLQRLVTEYSILGLMMRLQNSTPSNSFIYGDERVLASNC